MLRAGKYSKLMPEADDFFKHCSPVIQDDMARCGSLSLCNSVRADSAADFDASWRDGEDWRVLEPLLMSHFELKAMGCGRHQFGLKDFFVSQIKNVKRMISPENWTESDRKVLPFLLAEDKVPINDKYWGVTNGAADGDNWVVRVKSGSGIPANVRSFGIGTAVYIKSAAAGGMNPWMGKVAAEPPPTLVGNASDGYIQLALIPQNNTSFFPNIENPVTGFLTRGPTVTGKYENKCTSQPTYLNKVMKDYWPQWTRHTFEKCELTQEFFRYILDKNPLYKKFFHKPEIEAERESLASFWDTLWENAIWNRPSSPYQNVNDFRLLDKEIIYLSPTGLGFGGGECNGYKTENMGWMEQWQRCESIVDLQGATLDMWSLIDLAYDLRRVRFATGSPATVHMTAFADLSTAELIDRGFIKLQKERTDSAFSITMEQNGGNQPTNAFGFQFRKYNLPGKGYGITLEIATHPSFDDYISEWNAINNEDMGRQLWLLDPTNFYLGILDSERSENRTGTIAEQAAVDPNMLCVQRVVKKSVSLLGVGFVSIVECAARDRLLHNFANAVPITNPEAVHPSYTPALVGYDYGY